MQKINLIALSVLELSHCENSHNDNDDNDDGNDDNDNVCIPSQTKLYIFRSQQSMNKLTPNKYDPNYNVSWGFVQFSMG